jgi:tetratricopeptide (TPR) repeat protein
MNRSFRRCLLFVAATSGPIYAGLSTRTAVPANEPAAESNAASCPDLAQQAEAKMKAKQWPEAIALWERVVELNPVVGDYWARLARARYDAKKYRESIVAHEKALELRAGYPWASAYDIGCCYALLGEKEPALKWVEKSLALGFRSLAGVRADEDLKCLHDDTRFRELVALVDPKTLSRDEGWRYDLHLLDRELKRLHYNLSKKIIPEGFDTYVRKLHDDIPKLTDHQIEVSMMRLTAMAGDGHTSIRPAHMASHGGDEHHALPVQFYLFEEGLFITLAAPAHKELAGARVLRVGDHPVADVLKALDPLISRDNDIWPKFIGPGLLRQPRLLNGLGLIPEDDRVQLTVRDPGGKEQTVTLAGNAGDAAADWVSARDQTAGPDPLYLKNRKATYWFEYLPDSKTVFLQYNAVQNDPKENLEKFCGRVFEFINKNDVNRLVIDLRWNSGGNNFLNRPLVHGLIRCDKINQPGKLFVIVGRNTFSAAQCGATQIERHTEAIFVGEPTGSAPNFVGETIMLDLPYSKMRASISDLYWQNSVAMDYRTWIGPRIYTPPTFASYRARRDPALEAILQFKQTSSPTTDSTRTNPRRDGAASGG